MNHSSYAVTSLSSTLPPQISPLACPTFFAGLGDLGRARGRAFPLRSINESFTTEITESTEKKTGERNPVLSVCSVLKKKLAHSSRK
jgi:hypothetical protein